MELQILGGAQEIGKSCYLLKLGEKNILIDCGIGVGASRTPSLPNFDLIDKLDLILITHAHIDHSGALPIVFKKFPEAKIICTLPTFSLMMLLLTDTLKHLERDFLLYMKAGILFDLELLNKMAANIFTCYFNKWFFPFPDEKIEIAFIRAGHILGASQIAIKSKDSTFLFTGDFCLRNQYTVQKAVKPKLSVDVLITEATYGNKIHSREEEEFALIKAISRVLKQNGKVLLPAFAVGRSQELIRIMAIAQKREIILKTPVYIDGMVKDVCAIYEDQIGQEIFFDGNIERVETIEMRQEIIEDDNPCIIISSSGMLCGGPSVFYARKILTDEKSAILFTSFQDEESPGRSLLELQEHNRIFLDDELVVKNCRVGQYGISSHSDQKEICDLVNHYRPETIIIVHGEEDGRRTLASRFEKLEYQPKIFVPDDESTLEIK